MSKELSKFNAYVTHPSTQDYLAQVLGAQKETFVSALTSLVANDTKLQACTPATLMYSAIKSTALGLPLDNNLGFAYVIPYRNNQKGVTEAQFQIGYKGFIQLAMRSGQFKTINVTDVRVGELKGNNRLTGELEFEWIDEGRENHNIIGYVAYFRLINGFEKSLYMTVEQLNKHGQKYSKTFGKSYGNWQTQFESMASKTVLKLLLSKYAPMNVQHIHNAIKYDQAVIRGEDDAQYVDNGIIDIQADDDVAEIDRALYFIEQAKTKADIQKLRKELSPNILDSLAQDLDDKENSLEK